MQDSSQYLFLPLGRETFPSSRISVFLRDTNIQEDTA